MKIKPQRKKCFHLQVKWEVMKRKDVPKKTKATPTAPLVLIWEMILVVTVACSTSVQDTENVRIVDAMVFSNEAVTGPCEPITLYTHKSSNKEK